MWGNRAEGGKQFEAVVFITLQLVDQPVAAVLVTVAEIFGGQDDRCANGVHPSWGVKVQAVCCIGFSNARHSGL